MIKMPKTFGEWLEIILLLLIALFVFLLTQVDNSKSEECRDKGGVYIWRQGECVKRA